MAKTLKHRKKNFKQSVDKDFKTKNWSLTMNVFENVMNGNASLEEVQTALKSIIEKNKTVLENVLDDDIETVERKRAIKAIIDMYGKDKVLIDDNRKYCLVDTGKQKEICVRLCKTEKFNKYGNKIAEELGLEGNYFIETNCSFFDKDMFLFKLIDENKVFIKTNYREITNKIVVTLVVPMIMRVETSILCDESYTEHLDRGYREIKERKENEEQRINKKIFSNIAKSLN